MCSLHLGCKHEKPPPVQKPNSPFRPYRDVQADYEQRLKTSNAEIIEQLLTTYHRGLDPTLSEAQQREAELAFRAAMVRLEYWYTHGGREYLLPAPQPDE